MRHIYIYETPGSKILGLIKIGDAYYPFIEPDTKHEKIINVLGGDMKFDVIIGNPPYQIKTGGYGAQAKPIYHRFVEQALNLGAKYTSFIIPSRWFSGGMGLDSFRENMISNRSISYIADNPELFDVFPSVEIKGGICYFLIDKGHNGDCEFVTKIKGVTITRSIRDLREGSGVVIRENEATPILEKVQLRSESVLSSMVSSINPFSIPTNFKDYRMEAFDGAVLLKSREEFGFVPESSIKANRELVDQIKVLIPQASDGHGRVPKKVLGSPIILDRNSACTMTYLVAGAFDDMESAVNFSEYLKTKFVRMLVSLRKASQHNSKSVFEFVPQQDFNRSWSDLDLYIKYGLSEEEINYIESTIEYMR